MALIGQISLALTLAALHYVAAQTFGATPFLGYNSYNQLACSPNETTMTKAINALVDRGFLAAGYDYFTVDCGWSARDGQRNATTGALRVDPNRFSNGLQPLSNLARSRGLRWTMYSDAGVRMCDTEVPSPVLGSLGHEQADAEFFKSMGTEYVKYDNCYIDGPTSAQNAPKDPRTDFPSRFSAMWTALQRVGIPGMLICQWGTPYSSPAGLQGPNQWTRGISTSFRLSDDIAQGWNNVYRIYNEAVHIAKSGLIGPGHFADADLLEVGNPGMTLTEQATHFAAWAMLKSSLMVSTDVNALSNDALAILQNRDLIAINQDPIGQPIRLVQRWTSDRDLWAGQLSNGDLAVLVTDLSNTARTLSLYLSNLNITSATIHNLWTGSTTQATSSSPYSSSVSAHGSLPLRLSSIVRSSPSPAPRITYTSASSGTLSRSASLASCSGCSAPSKQKVGNLGGPSNGTLTLSLPTNTAFSSSTQTLLFDYINGEVAFAFDGKGLVNERLASVSVNGGPAKTVSFPLSGYNWERDVYADYRVELQGFRTGAGAANTITISGSGSGYAPDLDRIGVTA